MGNSSPTQVEPVIRFLPVATEMFPRALKATTAVQLPRFETGTFFAPDAASWHSRFRLVSGVRRSLLNGGPSCITLLLAMAYGKERESSQLKLRYCAHIAECGAFLDELTGSSCADRISLHQYGGLGKLLSFLEKSATSHSLRVWGFCGCDLDEDRAGVLRYQLEIVETALANKLPDTAERGSDASAS